MAEAITAPAESADDGPPDGKSIAGYFASIIPCFKPYRGWLTLAGRILFHAQD